MEVGLIGANGKVGREFLKQALPHHIRVNALARNRTALNEFLGEFIHTQEKGFTMRLRKPDSLEQLTQSDSEVIIICAGQHDKDRSKVIEPNSKIIAEIARAFKHDPRKDERFYIIVPNPVEPLTYLFFQESGILPSRIAGLSTLDFSRLRKIIRKLAEENYDLPEGFITEGAYVFGPHDERLFQIDTQGLEFYDRFKIPIPQEIIKPEEFLQEYGDKISQLVRGYAKEQVEKLGDTAFSTSLNLMDIINLIINRGGFSISHLSIFTNIDGESYFIGQPVCTNPYGFEPFEDLEEIYKKGDPAFQRKFEAGLAYFNHMFLIGNDAIQASKL